MGEHTIYLGIGSNVDRERAVTGCLDSLDDAFDLIAISSVVESVAVGFSGDPFLNLVVSAQTSQDVGGVMMRLRQIEDRHGRVRTEQKFSDRTLDIDLLLYDALQGEIDGVLLPRPELLEQAYILAPMAEIAPELVLPGTTSTISQLLQAFTGDRDGMRMIEFSWRGESLPRL